MIIKIVHYEVSSEKQAILYFIMTFKQNKKMELYLDSLIDMNSNQNGGQMDLNILGNILSIEKKAKKKINKQKNKSKNKTTKMQQPFPKKRNAETFKEASAVASLLHFVFFFPFSFYKLNAVWSCEHI